MMRNKILTIETKGPSIIDITPQVLEIVEELSEFQALCHVFLQHSTASLFIGENGAEEVHKDLQGFMERLVPEGSPDYTQYPGGLQDAPAYIRTLLTHTEVTIPLIDGRMMLGEWQSLYLWEHCKEGFHRHVIVTIHS